MPIKRLSGGKQPLGRIAKVADRYLRRLLVIGMTARLKKMKVHPDRVDPCAMSLRERPRAHGYRRHGQQNGPHHLGGFDPQRKVSASDSINANKRAPETQDHRDDGAMSSRQPRHPVKCQGHVVVREAVCYLVSGSYQVQWQRAPRNETGHATAPDRRSHQLKNLLLCRSHPHRASAATAISVCKQPNFCKAAASLASS